MKVWVAALGLVVFMACDGGDNAARTAHDAEASDAAGQEVGAEVDAGHGILDAEADTSSAGDASAHPACVPGHLDVRIDDRPFCSSGGEMEVARGADRGEVVGSVVMACDLELLNVVVIQDTPPPSRVTVGYQVRQDPTDPWGPTWLALVDRDSSGTFTGGTVQEISAWLDDPNCVAIELEADLAQAGGPVGHQIRASFRLAPGRADF